METPVSEKGASQYVEEIRIRGIASPTVACPDATTCCGAQEFCSSSPGTGHDRLFNLHQGGLEKVKKTCRLKDGWKEKFELRRHTVAIGKNGRIKGDIYGKIITVEGTIEGNLYGEEQLIVRQSGTVRGNIVAPRVVLEEPVHF